MLTLGKKMDRALQREQEIVKLNHPMRSNQAVQRNGNLILVSITLRFLASRRSLVVKGSQVKAMGLSFFLTHQ